MARGCCGQAGLQHCWLGRQELDWRSYKGRDGGGALRDPSGHAVSLQ